MEKGKWLMSGFMLGLVGAGVAEWLGGGLQ